MDDLANAASNAANDTSLSDVATSAPVEQDHQPASSSREAIDRAFAKVNGDGESSAVNRARDETGRFAQKAAEAATKSIGGQTPIEGAVPPPARFTKAAQAEWANAPETIRTEVARLEAELTQGIEKYRPAAEAFEPIRQFDEMAKASGTTLDAALTAYTNMEGAWRSDPAKGFLAVCQNMGVDPVAQAKAIYERLSNSGGVPQGDHPDVATLKMQVASLESQLASKLGNFDQYIQTQKQAPIMQEVAKFSETAPFFDLLATDIVAEIKVIQSQGRHPNLQEVYDAAINRHPQLSAVIAAEKAAKAAPKSPPEAQTRKASLSITGTPSAGSNPSSMKPAGSTREAVNSALARVGIT